MSRFTQKLAILVLALISTCAAAAQPAIQPSADITKVPAAARPSPHFDADAATDAYMAMMPPAAVARSNAYFEGGYWLILWDFLCASGVSLLLLNLRWSACMRNAATRIARKKSIQVLLYWVQYLVVTAAIGFPLNFYENYEREHQYGLSTQNFGHWLGDELKVLLVSLLLGSIAVVIIFAIVRKFQKSWWIWGSLATIVLVTVAIAISPVFLQPLFNTPKKLTDPNVVAPILRMAHANGIPANDVYEIDVSRQSTRMSANVSGFGSTMRITLSDNLLQRGSSEEVQAVMGHEMGHYVLDHVLQTIMFMTIVVVLSFAYLFYGLRWALTRWGNRWQIHDVSDPAVAPLAMLLIGILIFILTPVFNSQIRMEEKQADTFGLNAARQPDGFAQSAIHLGEFRKMHPGTIEEILFYDHPSGYNRIHAAMVWKSQNLELFQDQNGQPGK